MSERRCEQCRFGDAVDQPSGRVRCCWVTESQDEAGDRMPAWAHAWLRYLPDAVGRAERAEECPAFDEGALDGEDGELIATCPECEGTGKGDFDNFMTDDASEPDDDGKPARKICAVCCGFGRLDW